jgi:toxin CcdB
MARFAVYEMRGVSGGRVVDLQSDFLDWLNTRLVAPLVPFAQVPIPAKHLNPVFTLPDGKYVLLIQSMAAVRASELGSIVADLSPESDAITRALDMVFQGF